jgi:hypothetical protein
MQILASLTSRHNGNRTIPVPELEEWCQCSSAQNAERLVAAAENINGSASVCDGRKNKPYGAYALEKLRSIYHYEIEDKRGCVSPDAVANDCI